MATTRCSRLVLCIFHSRPIISHFSKELGFFYLEDGIRNQIWVADVLVAVRASFLLTTRKCVCTKQCVDTYL